MHRRWRAIPACDGGFASGAVCRVTSGPPPAGHPCGARSVGWRERGESMSELNGRIAIVTGGATLIGARIAQALQRAGASVVIADINESDGKRVAKELGPSALFQWTDITDDASLDSCV